ncbi:pectate lyase [Diaporthe helianthi]|uniref:Pectate lyase n=1 Tax=Diaporthe helianthi TaxID=158607 RepID=A0A2P5I8T9_DIAHE|nr:pectate lyase [Diaporthe helianthi]
MQYAVLIASLAIGAIASPAPAAVTPAPQARDIQKRLNVPASSGSSVLEDVKTIASGDSFDGGMYVFDRGVSCTGQSEGGESDAVFQIENGGTLKNVIIGPNQIEGVHCQGACTLENVWWPQVCEDAFTIKKQAAGETTYIKGGGAAGAEDKVLQHNGGGSLEVSDFEVDDFGKLYRSCGNCKTMYERHFSISGSTATDGKTICGINSNYGDSCTITDTTTDGVKDVCVTYTGTDDNDKEPVKNSDNGDGCDGSFCVC